MTGRRSQGRRDYAVLITLLRPDLRAGEAAARTLEDLGWRAAENVVHGKAAAMNGFRCPTMSAPAIAAYLRRGRPETNRRKVFQPHCQSPARPRVVRKAPLMAVQNWGRPGQTWSDLLLEPT